MNTYKSRSERRIAKQRAQQKNLQRAAVVVGTGLVTLPTVGLTNGQNVQASEYNYQQPDAAAALIAQIAPAASQIADANDLYASVMIAQALLESGNGGSTLAQAPYYNLFGVKGTYNGMAVYMPTLEYLNGQWVTINEPFRQYGSYWESIQDHANVLRSTSFSSGVYHYSGAFKSNTSSYLDATAYLTGRYATDPGYASKLNYLIAAYGLTQYDTSSTSNTYVANSNTQTTQATTYAENTTSSESSEEVQVKSSTSVHKVVSGDTLWGIANTYGITVDQLMTQNGLSSDLIVVGQELIV